VSETQSVACRGVRGAITVETNDAQAILEATRELLTALTMENQIEVDDIGSVIFSTTVDLNAEYPAVAARQLGWHDTALICTHEMVVPHGLPKVVRVLIMWNTSRAAHEIQHVYLRDAHVLRPDRLATLPIQSD
jgi:chorismate mutase